MKTFCDISGATIAGTLIVGALVGMIAAAYIDGHREGFYKCERLHRAADAIESGCGSDGGPGCVTP